MIEQIGLQSSRLRKTSQKSNRWSNLHRDSTAPLNCEQKMQAKSLDACAIARFAMLLGC